jgi:hypothetical protein
MINKCQHLNAFKFENTEIIVELHRGNPVYGYRLCVYKKINPIEHKLIYDESQFHAHGLDGWKKYDEKISKFVNSLLDTIS